MLPRSNTENAGRAIQSLKDCEPLALDHGSPPAHTPYLVVARCVFRPTNPAIHNPRSAFYHAFAGCSRGLMTSVRKLPFRKLVHQRTIGEAIKIDE
jgi:hypothetical protein